MYLSELKIVNFRQFGAATPFLLELQPGVTALVGENDAGKTAIIDAIRYALLTRDSDYFRVQPDDFHVDSSGQSASEIEIRCKLAGLNQIEKGAFAEFLTYEAGKTVLYVYWRARRNDGKGIRRLADVSVRSGADGAGASLDLPIRQMLAAAYLRPLRDAEREMSPGQGSRLSQVLNSYPGIEDGELFDSTSPPQSSDEAAKLGLVAMSDYMRHLVNQHGAVVSAQDSINRKYLSQLTLAGERLHGQVSFTEGGSPALRLRQILERLQLNLLEEPGTAAKGKFGLGSNNLLYMACELLLLAKDPEGLPLLLIEEPEAHLHPQRQLRLMDFLLAAAGTSVDKDSRPVQVLVTTHSPNLSSRIPLRNLVLVDRQRAFPLVEGKTKLDASDYRFLERFLDSTKANLFFARGVLIVEGDAEAILLPYLAKAVGRDLTEHGVSIVNVGGTGLRRYSRILQRADGQPDQISVPVACVADMDVMPDCAPELLGYVSGDDDSSWSNRRRRWRAVRDFPGDKLEAKRASLSLGDGGAVRTFVADRWTFEYDLAYAGMAEEVYTAGVLAANDDPLNDERKTHVEVKATAAAEFATLVTKAAGDNEVLCTLVYELFSSRRASKAVAAQYLAEILAEKSKDPAYAEQLPNRLPTYITGAIRYVTERPANVPSPANGVGAS